MKKISLVIMVIFGILILVACRKSYPKDIPDWLKDKIKVIDKENRGNNSCKYEKCQSVDERTDGTNHIFIWHTGSMGPFVDYVYDLEGNELCVINSDSLTEPCANIDHYKDYYFDRLIWEESYSGLYKII
jgi:hypothetical protein